jgi:hypothetical protein
VLSCALIANAASSCPTDLDQDGSTGFTDLVSLLGSWDTPEGDIDGDGNTGFPDLTALLSAFGPCAGPTFEEPFHLPSLRDPSTLDVEIVEDWHVDTIDGTTRQKVINIHVDDWWPGVEIRVPVRMIVPLNASAQGFTITGAGLDDFEGDHPISSDKQVALDAGAGVVITKIKSVNSYPELPSENMMRQRFGATLDWRYSEYFLWGSIMMRSITAGGPRKLQERHDTPDQLYSRRSDHRRVQRCRRNRIHPHSSAGSCGPRRGDGSQRRL